MKQNSMTLTQAFEEVSASSAGGAPFLIAYGTTFIISGILSFVLPAETAVSRSKSRYPWDDVALQDAWQTELDLLATAVQAKTNAEMADLAQQFLAQRTQRRQADGLDSGLIDYEQQREWLEGLARYAELETWRQAALTEGYQPVSTLLDDPDFDEYATFDKRWTQEIDQIHRMADDEGDGRFYYSGMAQAVILDRLLPDWKAQALADGVFLEDLLKTAVGLPVED